MMMSNYDGTMVYLRGGDEIVYCVLVSSADVDARLVRGLSSDDISASFDPSARQTHATWYRHGFLVDLSCKNSTDAFRQVIESDRVGSYSRSAQIVFTIDEIRDTARQTGLSSFSHSA